MPSNGTIVDTSSALERDCAQLQMGEEDSDENRNVEDKQENGSSMKKMSRSGRKRKHLVESFESSKESISAQKCHFSLDSRSSEPLLNGDLGQAVSQCTVLTPTQEEDGSCREPDTRDTRNFQEDSDNLQDGEIGQPLENGRCTPPGVQDWQEDEEMELEPVTRKKKRGRRRLLDVPEKSNEDKEEHSCDSADLEETMDPNKRHEARHGMVCAKKG